MDFALNSNYALNEMYQNYGNSTVTNPISVSEDETIKDDEKYNYEETYSFSESVTEDDTSINSTDELRNELEQIKKEQGFFGKTWDTVKNKFTFLSKLGFIGSDEVEEIIAKAESGEITTEEAKEAVEKYKKNQDNGTEVILDTITAGVVTGVCLLAGPLGWGTLAILGVATAVGGFTRLALGAGEAATNEVEGDYTKEDAEEDFARGGVIGFFTGMSKIIGGKIFGRAKKEVLDKLEKHSDKLYYMTKNSFGSNFFTSLS